MNTLRAHKKWEPFRGRYSRRLPKRSRPVEMKMGQFALEGSAEFKSSQGTGNEDLQKYDFQHFKACAS